MFIKKYSALSELFFQSKKYQFHYNSYNSVGPINF